MDLRQLRYFVAIANSESLSKASTLVGVSQSALTRQLQIMEEEFGVPLLYRTGHGVVLTDAGQRFIVLANDIIARSDAAMLEMQALRATPSGTVIVGVPPMIGEFLLVPLSRRFTNDFPDVFLHIREAISGYMLEWVVTGQVDLAIVYNAPKRSNLGLEPLVSDDLMLVGPANDPLMQSSAPIDLKDVCALPLIMVSPGHGLRDLLDTAARSHSTQPNIVLVIDGMHTIVRFVEAGFGYTCFPFAAVASKVAAGLLQVRPIVNPVLPGVLSIAMSSQRPATQAMKHLYRYIREEVSMLVASKVWQHRHPGEDSRVMTDSSHQP